VRSRANWFRGKLTTRCDHRDVKPSSADEAATSTRMRFMFFGALIAGGLGAIKGFLVGLDTYAPTAWAAAIEVGIPAALVGAIVGLVVSFAAGDD
jgi:hypothetical protein